MQKRGEQGAIALPVLKTTDSKHKRCPVSLHPVCTYNGGVYVRLSNNCVSTDWAHRESVRERQPLSEEATVSASLLMAAPCAAAERACGIALMSDAALLVPKPLAGERPTGEQSVSVKCRAVQSEQLYSCCADQPDAVCPFTSTAKPPEQYIHSPQPHGTSVRTKAKKIQPVEPFIDKHHEDNCNDDNQFRLRLFKLEQLFSRFVSDWEEYRVHHHKKTELKKFCRYCNKSSHSAAICYLLSKADKEHKDQFVRDHGLCYKCLEADHTSAECTSTRPCCVRKCGGIHPPSIFHVLWRPKEGKRSGPQKPAM